MWVRGGERTLDLRVHSFLLKTQVALRLGHVSATIHQRAEAWCGDSLVEPNCSSWAHQERSVIVVNFAEKPPLGQFHAGLLPAPGRFATNPLRVPLAQLQRGPSLDPCAVPKLSLPHPDRPAAGFDP